MTSESLRIHLCTLDNISLQDEPAGLRPGTVCSCDGSQEKPKSREPSKGQGCVTSGQGQVR